MTENVKSRRRYNAPRRAEQAAATRRAVLDAARELFVAKGYLATTVAEIAERAGVAVDTIYATVGRKPMLIREVVETAISGQDRAIPADERDYVKAMIAAPTAREKLAIYAGALTELLPRIAPVFAALRDAGLSGDTDCAALYAEITGRRAANMRRAAVDMRATGQLRTDLTDDEVADIIWSLNSTEYWTLLVDQRGWTTERFGAWLADAWARLLLADPA